MQQNKRWIVKAKNGADTGTESIIRKILYNRGIDDEESMESFLHPDLEKFHDPFLLPDMKSAVDTIKVAVESGKRIVIYGDYDADGVTSTSILYKCLKNIGADVGYYIPNRLDEGYGLNIEAIDDIVKDGANLIITVDCGIASIEEVEYCKGLGVHIIITDHHECKDSIPNTLVINPKRHDSKYPFGDLAGVGVAFKLIQGLKSVFNCIDPMEYIELAAIGTIGDVVTLLDENRIIVKFGIESMRQSRNKGLLALLEVVNIKPGDINTGHISFMIVPRINAVGRISNAKLGVQLFTSDDEGETKNIASELNEENRTRQEIEEKILSQAEDKLYDDYDKNEDLVIILEDEGWHIGVVGIVASRLTEKYYRPTILFSREGGTCKGSARSIPGFNMFEALSECSDILIKFGGHEQAAGLTISYDNLEMFKERMNDIAKKKLARKYLMPVVEADCEIKGKDVTFELLDNLNKLEPFGTGNPPPIFILRSMNIEEIRTVGAKDNHLKMRLRDEQEKFDAIAFNMGYNISGYSRKDMIDVVCSLDRNVWNGRESMQLMIKDMRKSPFNCIEDDYYRSLRNLIKRLSKMESMEVDSLECFKQCGASLCDILENENKNESSIVFVSCIRELKHILECTGYYKISFETVDKHVKGVTSVVINPDPERIDFQNIDNVYIADNLVDYKYIKDKCLNKPYNTVWNIMRSDAGPDIDFVNSIKPSVENIEKVYSLIKTMVAKKMLVSSVEKLSIMLEMNKLSVYYCLNILRELNRISISAGENESILFGLNDSESISTFSSNTMKKFDIIINRLNKINKIFRDIKGE